MSDTSLHLRSTITPEGKLRLSLVSREVPTPGPEEVLVRVEASPINPSDLGMLCGPADMSTARALGTVDEPVVEADIDGRFLGAVKGRLGKPMAVGNEGAGVVVATGDSDKARALMGKTVAVLGGAMYGQHRCIHADACLPLPQGVTPRQGASCFVNPLTALGMLETMRMEGHTALVHTAAASNLGQMLNKLCNNDGVGLVNIVRKPEQVQLLEDLGAKLVVNSSDDSYKEDLVEALTETGATLAFDAVGGGKLAGQILTAMETAANAKASGYDRYGSSTHKQVYIYGGLDRSPTILRRSFGMAWGVGGWLLTPLLMKVGGEVAGKMRQRVADEITTTFSSTYTREVSLREALEPEAIAAYTRQATGEKYLINPNKGL